MAPIELSNGLGAVVTFTLAVPAQGTKCAQDWPDFTAPAARSLKSAKAAAAKVEIAPRTRPLRLPY